MTDDKEAVEHAERNRWHSEEIHGRNCFPMVSEEGQPAPAPAQGLSALVSSNERWFSRKVQNRACGVPHGFAALPTWGSQRPCGRSIPELPLASVSVGPASELWRSAASTYKNSPAPADDSFGRHDEKGLLPSRADSPSDNPEELIEDA